MGNDPNVFVNNLIFDGNINSTLDKIIKNMKINIFIRSDENDDLNIEIDNNTFIIDLVDYDDKHTLESYFNKHGSIFLEKIEYIPKYGDFKIGQNDKFGQIDGIYVSKYCINYSDNLFFPGRWSGFKKYLDNTLDSDLINYCNDQIEMFINFSKKVFNSNELIIFMDYENEDIWDKLVGGASFNEILNDKRWNILHEIPIKKANNDNYLIYRKI
jgi:hypothetical protein